MKPAPGRHRREMLQLQTVAQTVPSGEAPDREEARMPVTTALQTLTADEALAPLRPLRTRQPVKFSAFYPRQLGAVATDPALPAPPLPNPTGHPGHGTFVPAATQARADYALDA